MFRTFLAFMIFPLVLTCYSYCYSLFHFSNLSVRLSFTLLRYLSLFVQYPSFCSSINDFLSQYPFFSVQVSFTFWPVSVTFCSSNRHFVLSVNFYPMTRLLMYIHCNWLLVLDLVMPCTGELQTHENIDGPMIKNNAPMCILPLSHDWPLRHISRLNSPKLKTDP